MVKKTLKTVWTYAAPVIAGGLTFGVIEALSAQAVTLAGCNPADDFAASILARARFYTAFVAVLGGAVFALGAAVKARFAPRSRFSPARLAVAHIFGWAAAANVFWYVLAAGPIKKATLFGHEYNLVRAGGFFPAAFPILVLGVAALTFAFYKASALLPKRRRAAVYAGALSLLGWAALAAWDAAGRPPATDSGYPDVLLITLDAWRADSWGVTRDGRPLTPHLDRFATDAYVFRDARVQATWTLPSFATIFTSQYPAVHGASPDRRVGRGQPTLAGVLGAHGYETYAVIGNNLCLPNTGLMRGFDDYYYWDMKPWLKALGYYETYAFYPALRGDRKETTPEPITTILTDEVVRRLGRNRERPLFLWVHYLDPHKPYRPPQEYSPVPVPTKSELWHLPPKKKFPVTRRLYDAEIRYVDAELGRVFAALPDRPPAVVVISSDHGEEFGERFKRGPKKELGTRGHGHGHTLYEELLRVPLIIKFPDRGGAVVDAPVGLIDLAPIVLDYVGIAKPPSMQGRRLREIVENRAGEEPVFAGPTQLYDGKKEGVCFGGRKLIYEHKKERYLYFDLEADPGEKHPLDADSPEARELKALLARWREENARLSASYAAGDEAVDLEAALRALGYVK